MVERRLSTRIPFRQRIKYGSTNLTFTGYTFNLSEGGIGITTNKVLPPKSRITMHIYMGNETLKIEGIVAWTSPVLPGIQSKMGVKFSSRTDDIRDIYQQRLSRINTDILSTSIVYS
jgi:PilZ domain.